MPSTRPDDGRHDADQESFRQVLGGCEHVSGATPRAAHSEVERVEVADDGISFTGTLIGV